MATGDFERERFEHFRHLHDAAKAEWETDELYYQRQFGEDVIPEDWADESLRNDANRLALPTAYNAVENASDHILTTPSTFVPTRPMQAGVQAAQLQAEDQRKFHDMWWHRVRLDYGDPLQRAKKKLVKQGKAVLKKTIDWDIVPDMDDFPSKRAYRTALERVGRSRFLWKCELIPNERVYEDLDHQHNPQFVYERYQILVADARRMYGDIRILEGMREFQTIDYMECWELPHGTNPGQMIAWVGEEVVHEGENPYSWETALSTSSKRDYDGYVPYAVMASGWGDDGPEAKATERYVGIIRPIREVVVAETRFAIEMDAWLRMYVFPHLVTTNMPDLNDDERNLRLGPGGHTDLDEEQQMDILRWGEIPASLFQGMQRVNDYADEASKFGVLGGAPQRGVDTATEADQNIRNASTKLSSPVAAMERACMLINRWVLQDIEQVLEAPVTLYGATPHGAAEITLTPREIRGYYETFVELTTSDQQALNAREARLAADLHRIIPSYSQRTALERAGEKQPMQEMIQAAVERVFFSEPMEQARILTALAGMGEIGQQVAQDLRAATQGTATPGDEQALTTLDGLGNPVAPVVTDARNNALADQAARQFQ